MNETFVINLFSGILVAAASGLIGSLLVLRKMTLLSDALSHIALPGIALGILFHFQPLFGGLLFLLFGVVLIWMIEHKTKLAVESITGVLFVTALAIGALLIPEEELLETFFGSVENLTWNQIILQSLLAVLIIFFTFRYLKPLVLVSIAPDLSTASKISQPKMELLLLFLIAITITVGISFVGVLLMSALLIIPAVTARNLSGNFKSFIAFSIILAVVSITGGLLASNLYAISPGIATVLVSSVFFILSLFKKRT